MPTGLEAPTGQKLQVHDGAHTPRSSHLGEDGYVNPLLFMESYNAFLCTVFLAVLIYLRYKFAQLRRLSVSPRQSSQSTCHISSGVLGGGRSRLVNDSGEPGESDCMRASDL